MDDNKEKLLDIAKSIMKLSRNTLLVNLRFLDLALGQFRVGAGRAQGLADVGALGCGECTDLVGGGGRAARESAASGQSREDGVLVDGRHLNNRCDASRNECCAACGGS